MRESVELVIATVGRLTSRETRKKRTAKFTLGITGRCRKARDEKVEIKGKKKKIKDDGEKRYCCAFYASLGVC